MDTKLLLRKLTILLATKPLGPQSLLGFCTMNVHFYDVFSEPCAKAHAFKFNPCAKAHAFQMNPCAKARAHVENVLNLFCTLLSTPYMLICTSMTLRVFWRRTITRG